MSMLSWNKVLKFAREGNLKPDCPVEKSDEEWRSQLTPEQYKITRLKGTERPFSSEMCGLFEPGSYSCICCGASLFDSSGKFDSGTGWPAFYSPFKKDSVVEYLDKSHGMIRKEVRCGSCDAHLGHVFDDGPEPTGLRYCINSVVLNFIPE